MDTRENIPEKTLKSGQASTTFFDDHYSKKRESSATYDEQATKKQKTSPVEGFTNRSSSTADSESWEQRSENEDSKNDGAESPRQIERPERIGCEAALQEDICKISPEERLTVTRKEHKAILARARSMIEKKTDQVSDLRDANKDLVAMLAKSKKTSDETLSTVEDDRDDWQARALRAEEENNGFAKSQKEYDARFWESVKVWKREEIKCQIEEMNDEYEDAKQKNETTWKKKVDTLKNRHQKEKDAIDGKVDAMRADLRESKNQLKILTREHKLRNSPKVKELEKIVKEKDKIIQNLQESHEMTKAEVSKLEENNENLRGEKRYLLEVSEKSHGDATKWEARFHKQQQATLTMEGDHKRKLMKQVELWQIQYDNSQQNAQRAVQSQRTTQMLSHTNQRLIGEKQELVDRIVAIESEIRQLRAAKGAASPKLSPHKTRLSAVSSGMALQADADDRREIETKGDKYSDIEAEALEARLRGALGMTSSTEMTGMSHMDDISTPPPVSFVSDVGTDSVAAMVSVDVEAGDEAVKGGL